MNSLPASRFREFLRAKVESGEYPSEEAVWEEAMRRFREADLAQFERNEEAIPADPIDYEAIEDCERQVEGQEIPSLDEVRRILSKIPGSLAAAVAEEREDRF